MGAEGIDQLPCVIVAGRVSEDEARQVVLTGPGQKADAGFLEALKSRGIPANKDLVGLRGVFQARFRMRLDGCREARRLPVGVAGEFQPQVVLDVGQELRGQIAHLAVQMAAAFAVPLCYCIGLVPLKKHQRLGRHAAIFTGSEGQHIHTGPPGQVRRGAAQGGDGVTKTRAVQVRRQARLPGHGIERQQLTGGVQGAAFRALGQAQGRGLVTVNAMPGGAMHGAAQGLRVQLAIVAVAQHQAQAAAVKLRGAGFIAIDMRVAVTQHRTPGRGHAGQRNRVGDRAGGHGQDPHRVFEKRGERFVQAQGPVVLAVGKSGSMVGFQNGLHDRLGNRGLVIAAKIGAHGLSCDPGKGADYSESGGRRA